MSEFVAHLKEIFGELGAVSARRMFGGHGLFYDGRMFGLIANDVLYLKADAESAPQFRKKGLSQFEYVKNGKPMKMSYYQAPEEIFDDSEEATQWAMLACAAAKRAATTAKARRSS